jgi:hypothetical protein
MPRNDDFTPKEAEAEKRFLSQMESLEKLSPSKRLNWYLSYFNQTFKGLMSDESFRYAEAGICKIFTYESHPEAMTLLKFVVIFENELKFLKEIIKMPSVPKRSCKLLTIYYVDILERKIKGIVTWPVTGSSNEDKNLGVRKKELILEAVQILNQLEKPRRNIKASTGLPKSFIAHFKGNNFYNDGIRIKLSKEMPIITEEFPSLLDKASNAYILKSYLILAKQLQITNDKKEAMTAASKLFSNKDTAEEKKNIEIKSMPMKSAPLVKIIETHTGLRKDQIYGRLKIILDKDHNQYKPKLPRRTTVLKPK